MKWLFWQGRGKRATIPHCRGRESAVAATTKSTGHNKRRVAKQACRSTSEPRKRPAAQARDQQVPRRIGRGATRKETNAKTNRRIGGRGADCDVEVRHCVSIIFKVI